MSAIMGSKISPAVRWSPVKPGSSTSIESPACIAALFVNVTVTAASKFSVVGANTSEVELSAASTPSVVATSLVAEAMLFQFGDGLVPLLSVVPFQGEGYRVVLEEQFLTVH